MDEPLMRGEKEEKKKTPWLAFGMTLLICLLLTAIAVLAMLYSFEITDEHHATDKQPLAIPSVSFRGPIVPTPLGIGSINGIAFSNNYSSVFIGASNGGVWRSNDYSPFLSAGTSPSPAPAVAWPSWEVLTDSLPCLSASTVAATAEGPGLLVYACGKVSSYLFYSGPLSGVFYSTDGGASWRASAGVEYGWDFSKVLILPDGQTVLAAAKTRQEPQEGSGFVWVFDHEDGGVFVSGNAGQSFVRSDDPLVADRSVTDLEYSAEAAMLYATLSDGTVVASSNQGASWMLISQGIDYAPMGPVVNSRVSVGGDMVYVIMCDDNNTGIAAWTTAGQSNWTQVMLPADLPAYGGRFFFDVTVDPYQDNLFYVGGAVDAVYRGNALLAGAAAGGIFTGLTTADNAPHADTRFMIFNPLTNSLLLGCDGGIYFLNDPQHETSTWQCLNGNLAITEMDSVAYDWRSGTIASGAQDNGVYTTLPQQQADLQGLPTPYGNFEVGDGEAVQFNTHVSPSVLYGSAQYLGGFFSWQVGTNVSQPTYINCSDCDVDSPFYTDLQLNSEDPNLMMVCGSPRAVCWQIDFEGEPLNPLPSVQRLFDLGDVTPISNYFFGGSRGGQSFPGVFFAVADNNFTYSKDGSGTVTTRTNNRQWYLHRDSQQLRNPKYRLAVNPADYYEIVTPTLMSRVHYTNDFGASWADISGNLQLVTGAVADPQAWGVCIVPITVQGLSVSAILVGTTSGVFATFSDHLGQWYPITRGSALPNVLISNLLFDANDNLLVIATMGRGWWTLPAALATLTSTYSYYLLP